MPIIFVHGVANRPGPDQKAGQEERAVFFRETVGKTVLKSSNATVYQPFWGDQVPPFPKDNPIIPPVKPGKGFTAFGANSFGAETFGAASGPLQGVTVGAGEVPQNERLVTLARRSFTEAIDVVWQECLQREDVKDNPESEAAIIDAGKTASKYAEANPQPDWVKKAADDDAFIEELMKNLKNWSAPGAHEPAIAGMQAFGFFDNVTGWLKGAANTVAQKIVDIPNDALLRAFRPSLSQGLVNFFGDVFFYQTYRGTKEAPGKIPQVVMDALRAARKEADHKNEPLVVVGHSMGGNILYDILTYYGADLKVDVLATVGCQASVFKQLNLFKSQEGGQFAGDTKAPKPVNVAKWMNIFDPQDILSFAFEPEFEGVKDYFFESPGGVLGAHGDYFKKVRFYERLVARIQEA